MDQIMLAAVCRIIIGQNGRRLSAYPDVHAAYMHGLLRDYFQYNPAVGVKTCYKYIRAVSPYPHFLIRHYAGTKGYRRNLADMMGICDACTSLILLRQIQREVYQWVEENLPAGAAVMVNRNYVAEKAGRKEIAVYLADTIHYAINAENGENRSIYDSSEL